MRTIITTVPEPGDDVTGLPPDWNLGRRLELRWLPDARHPQVVAEVVVDRVECDPDGTRHLHLTNAHGGSC